MDPQEEGMGLGARAAHTVSSVLGGNLVNILLTGLLLIALTRILGPSNYGVYTLAIAIAGIFGSVDSTGIATTLNKFVSEYRHGQDREAVRKVISEGITMVLMLGGTLTVAMFLLSGLIATYWLSNSSLTLVLQLASITIFTALFASALNGVLVGLGRGRDIITSLFVQSIFQVGVSLVLAFLDFKALAPVIGLIAAYIAGAITSYLIITRAHRIRMGLVGNMKSIRKLFSFSVPVTLSNMSVGILPNIAAVVLGVYETTAVVGNFGVGLKIYTLLGTVIMALSFSLLPTYTATLTDRKISEKISSAYNYSVYFAFVFLVPVILFISILAKQISYTLFGGTYVLAPYYIAIIGLGFVIWIIGAYASAVLTSASRVWEVLKYNLLVDVVVLGVMPFVSGYSNGFGVVIDVFLIAPILYDIVFFTRISKLFKIRLPTMKLARVVFTNIVVALLIYLIARAFGTNFVYSLVVSFVGMVVVYPVLIALTGGVDKEELKMLAEVTVKIPIVGVVARYFVAYASLAVR